MKIKYEVIKNILVAFVTAMALSSCAYNQVERYTTVWIDVRTPTEYATGHVENAFNIPYNEIAQRITEVVTNKDRKIDVYCASGGRAEIARETLAKLGYTDVTNAGGYRNLVKQ